MQTCDKAGEIVAVAAAAGETRSILDAWHLLRSDFLVGTRGKAAEEEAHADDGEDGHEREDDGEDVDRGGHRADQRLDDDPHAGVAHEQAQRAERAQDAQRREEAEVGVHDGEQAEEADGGETAAAAEQQPAKRRNSRKKGRKSKRKSGKH